jgi:SPP1 family predicted phage head-tail adaptor
MDRSSVITLLSRQDVQDSRGIWHDVGKEVRRQVFCQVDSVSRAEFFSAGQIGLKPEYRFTMFFGDYNDEELLEYNGQVYAVYRTYHARKDEVELYVTRKEGIRNGTEDPD